MLCPDPDNKCSQMPHVINNSWFKQDSQDTTFDSYIELWTKMDIVSVFCAGNNFKPETCNDLSVMPPGASSNKTITVGSTTKENRLSKFSRQGNRLVQDPDLVAPGSLIKSATNINPIAHGLASGTSMAAPHVTGTIALMMSVARQVAEELSFDQIKTILVSTATTSALEQPEFNCATDFTSYPNFAYGYGLLNTFQAIRQTQIELGQIPISAAVRLLNSWLFVLIILFY